MFQEKVVGKMTELESQLYQNIKTVLQGGGGGGGGMKFAAVEQIMCDFSKCDKLRTRKDIKD